MKRMAGMMLVRLKKVNLVSFQRIAFPFTRRMRRGGLAAVEAVVLRLRRGMRPNVCPVACATAAFLTIAMQAVRSASASVITIAQW